MLRVAIPDPVRETAPSVTCATCRACCCRLEVMLMGDDDPPPELTEVDRWGGRVMARLDDGWCAALERDTMRCGIYARRPGVCRDYPVGGDDCMDERARDASVTACLKRADRNGPSNL